MGNKFYLITSLLLVIFLKKGFSIASRNIFDTIHGLTRNTGIKAACDINEEFKGQADCDISCNTLNQPCSQDDPVLGPLDCICAPGFARNDIGGVCIPIEECSEYSCGENEVYLQQGRAPNCDTICATLGQECTIDFVQAPFGCYCQTGYARNESNYCVPIEWCDPPLCWFNEDWVPIEHTSPYCIKEGNNCHIEFIQIEHPECSCRRGYAKNEDGICIPYPLCLNSCGICDQNEEYAPQALCDTNCSTFFQPCNQSNQQDFLGCICSEGFARNASGTCIPMEHCPDYPCGDNQIYLQQGLAPNCDTECATFGQECTLIPIVLPFGCYCKRGYARGGPDFSCIRFEDCPKLCGLNEVFHPEGHAPYCESRCETLGQPCNIDVFEEKFGCYCEWGFARDINDICVPIECCPTPECGINEEWVLHFPLCEPSCTNIGQPCTIIPIMAPGPGCTCQQGYVRNDFGICIPQRQCPNLCEQTCGKNEVWLLQGEAPYCETRCDTLGMICDINHIWPPGPGCYCKDGYARNKYDECVPIKCCFRSNLFGF